MRRIIHNEFILHDYCLLEESEEFAYYKHNKYNDFWIICYGPFDLDNQSELYDQYLAKFVSTYPIIKKNTSLIIVGEQSAKSIEEIVAIENDPYLFKKYYLLYSPFASDELCSLLAHGDGLVSVERLMVNPEVFAKLKCETDEGAYHLLYTIAHKLPFLSVQVNHEELMSTELLLNEEQKACLDWCLGLSDDKERRKEMILEFCKETEA